MPEQEAPAADRDPWGPLLVSLAELKTFAAHFIQARRDLVVVRVLDGATLAVLALVAGVLAISVVVTAAVLVVLGAAEGFSLLLGDRAWAGKLIVGLSVCAFLAGGMLLARRHLKNLSKEKTRVAYDERRARQQHEFGRDSRQRARQQG